VLLYLRDAGVTPDERMAEAIGILESKRGPDGRWPLEHALHDELLVDLGEREDEPSDGSRSGRCGSSDGRRW
jgi:hypothetical protein